MCRDDQADLPGPSTEQVALQLSSSPGHGTGWLQVWSRHWCSPLTAHTQHSTFLSVMRVPCPDHGARAYVSALTSPSALILRAWTGGWSQRLTGGQPQPRPRLTHMISPRYRPAWPADPAPAPPLLTSDSGHWPAGAGPCSPAQAGPDNTVAALTVMSAKASFKLTTNWIYII